MAEGEADVLRHQVPVAVDGALRRAGRAGGKDQAPDVIGIDRLDRKRFPSLRVAQHRTEVDDALRAIERIPGQEQRRIDQMARIDRNVLRIALYELRVLGDAPAAAIIDEAVELAKMFGSEASPKFVNGVLATAVGGRKEPSA